MITIACSIGEHELCTGYGNDGDPDEETAAEFTCDCSCHNIQGDDRHE